MNRLGWAGAGLTALGLAAALAGCAGAGVGETATTGSTDTARQCVFARNISSFKAVDQDTVTFRANVNDIYQAELFAPCTDIQFSEMVGLRTRGGSETVCNPLDAELLVRGPTGVQRCALSSWRRLSPDEVAALAPRARP